MQAFSSQLVLFPGTKAHFSNKVEFYNIQAGCMWFVRIGGGGGNGMFRRLASLMLYVAQRRVAGLESVPTCFRRRLCNRGAEVNEVL